jgi:hypothetical protein
LLALLTAAGGVVAGAGPAAAAAQTRYVATGGNDAENDCLDAQNPCQHIQYAVDQADAGDTISIAAGTYAESVHIRESLTLIGAGATGANRTTIDGDTVSGDPSIWLDGIDTAAPPQVTVRHLDVSGNQDNDGIYVQGDPINETPVGLTVQDSVVNGNDQNGIEVLGKSTATITGTTISGNTNDGVLANTLVAAASVGVQAAAAPDAPAINLSRDTVSDNVDAGVEIEAGSVTADHSSISGNGGGGVVVWNAGTAGIDTSTLDHNTGAGLVITYSGGSATLTDSTVSGTRPFPAGDGET